MPLSVPWQTILGSERICHKHCLSKRDGQAMQLTANGHNGFNSGILRKACPKDPPPPPMYEFSLDADDRIATSMQTQCPLGQQFTLSKP